MKTFAGCNDLKQVSLVAIFIFFNEPELRNKQGNLELNCFASFFYKSTQNHKICSVLSKLNCLENNKVLTCSSTINTETTLPGVTNN
jgi:hypothetical protein